MTSFKFVGFENYSACLRIRSLLSPWSIPSSSLSDLFRSSYCSPLFVASQTYHQKCDCPFLLSFRLLPSSCYRSVAGNGCMEMDLWSTIRDFELCTEIWTCHQPKHFLVGDKHWALMAIIIIFLTTSVGQPIILYIAAMGNIDNSLVEAARGWCDRISSFLEDQMAKLIANNFVHCYHYDH